MSVPILISIILADVLIGLCLLFKSSSAIEAQRRFYEKINWRIEPISMPKEIRNTRIMGLFLIAMALLGVVYYLGYIR